MGFFAISSQLNREISLQGFEGTMVDEDDTESDKCLAYALRLLAGREFCRSEMSARLSARGFSESCVRQTVDRLIQLDYLSEERYGRAFFRVHLRRGEAPWLVAAKAKKKGVEEAVVEAVLADCLQSYDAVQSCRELLARRDPQNVHLEDRSVWQRHARYLRNKGFDAATIVHVMNAGKGQ